MNLDLYVPLLTSCCTAAVLNIYHGTRLRCCLFLNTPPEWKSRLQLLLMSQTICHRYLEILTEGHLLT